MIGWALALVVGSAFCALWWRERLRHRADLHQVAAWVRSLRSSGIAPEPHHKATAELLEAATEITRLASRMEEIRRDQTAEAANLQAILASMTEGVMMADSRHIIRLANPSLVRILDLKGSPIGKSVLEAVRDIHFEELIANTLALHGPQQVEISLGQVKPQRHLVVTSSAIRDGAGEAAVLLICHDVTRLKQLEDVRREFVANVSHELRTPLAIFQGYVETLIEAPDVSREDLLATLAILRKHSVRLNALVEDLLVLARLESRADVLCLEPIDPASVVRDIAADWKLRARDKKIELVHMCDPDAPAFEAAPFRLEQVLNNLVENALKYTNAGGRITLHAKACTDAIEFRVSDTGQGIPPQDLPHVFERFYRADKGRSREHGGTGLGLSIVKHIVLKHGGAVRAESTFGKGTTIVITLPATAHGETSAPEPGGEMKGAVNQREDHAELHLIE